MGASASSSAELGPLGVTAVAEITQFDADRLRVLTQLFFDRIRKPNSADNDGDDTGDAASHTSPPTFHVHHERRHEPNLSRTHFLEALATADFFASDVSIFDRIFTLLDRTGDDAIFAHEFLVGVCVLLRGDLAAKLQVAFELLQEEKSHEEQRVTKDDVVFVLHTMNQTATYFGDPVVMRKTVLALVDDVFGQNDTAGAERIQGDGQSAHAVSNARTSCSSLLPSADVTARVAQHPLVEQYLRGEFTGPTVST